MLQKIFILLIMATTLFASAEILLLKNINTIYSDTFYKDIRTLDSNITTQQRVQEDIEKILPIYLSSNKLFSSDILKESDENNTSIYKFKEFVLSSLIYMQYLESKNNNEQIKTIMEKHLINLNNLMLNSQNIIDYVLVLILYSDIYSHKISSSKALLSIFKKYPPTNKLIFFEKLTMEKNNLIDLMTTTLMKQGHSEDEKKLLKAITNAQAKYVNLYYKKMEVAIKSESQEAINNYNIYLDTEYKEISSIWNQVKKFWNLSIDTILYYTVGRNIDYDYWANYADQIGKISVHVGMSNYSVFYFEHIKMIEQYNALVQKHNSIND